MKQNQIKVKILPTGKTNTFTIKNGMVYDSRGKNPVYCSCTGNTKETATPMEYKNGEVYCPNCHEKKVEVIQTYEDYLQEKEEENKIRLENLKVICVGEDWECGLKFYGLSAQIPYEDWLSVKKYFSYKKRGWSKNQELEWYFNEPTGWITRDGYNVQKILYRKGLIKQENLREFQDWEMGVME